MNIAQAMRWQRGGRVHRRQGGGKRKKLEEARAGQAVGERRDVSRNGNADAADCGDIPVMAMKVNHDPQG